MKILLPRYVDPVVQNTEIEYAFARFLLFPCNGHEHGVHVQPCYIGEGCICLGRGTGRRIAQLTSQNEKWLALKQKLSTSPIDSNSRTASGLAVS